jgi:hypothetical protein
MMPCVAVGTSIGHAEHPATSATCPNQAEEHQEEVMEVEVVMEGTEVETEVTGMTGGETEMIAEMTERTEDIMAADTMMMTEEMTEEEIPETPVETESKMTGGIAETDPINSSCWVRHLPPECREPIGTYVGYLNECTNGEMLNLLVGEVSVCVWYKIVWLCELLLKVTEATVK